MTILCYASFLCYSYNNAVVVAYPGLEKSDLISITEMCLYMYFILNNACMSLSQLCIAFRAHPRTAALNAAQVLHLSAPSSIHSPVNGSIPPPPVPTSNTIFPGAGDLGHLREESIPAP